MSWHRYRTSKCWKSLFFSYKRLFKIRCYMRNCLKAYFDQIVFPYIPAFTLNFVNICQKLQSVCGTSWTMGQWENHATEYNKKLIHLKSSWKLHISALASFLLLQKWCRAWTAAYISFYTLFLKSLLALLLSLRLLPVVVPSAVIVVIVVIIICGLNQ